MVTYVPSLLYLGASLLIIYTLSLHDALPISPFTITTTLLLPAAGLLGTAALMLVALQLLTVAVAPPKVTVLEARKSTRLHSSHESNSYAAFGVKKKLVMVGVTVNVALLLAVV